MTPLRWVIFVAGFIFWAFVAALLVANHKRTELMKLHCGEYVDNVYVHCIGDPTAPTGVKFHDLNFEHPRQ